MRGREEQLKTLIDSVDDDLASLRKFRAKLMMALGALNGHRPAARKRRSAGESLRTFVLRVVRRRGQPMTADEIMTAVTRAGWKTTSANPRGLIGVELRKFWKRGYLSAPRGNPPRFRPGPKADLPEVKEPWQKKVEKAKALVAGR